jgi:hypothetical protein
MGGLSATVKYLYTELLRFHATTIPVRGLFIFGGAVPNYAEIDSWDANRYGSIQAMPRYGDLLLTYQPTVAPTYAANTLTYTMPTLKGLGNGIATWYLFGVLSNSTTDNHVFSGGSVGVKGSGADLEFNSTIITLGNSYVMPKFVFTLPNNTTY